MKGIWIGDVEDGLRETEWKIGRGWQWVSKMEEYYKGSQNPTRIVVVEWN